MKKQNMKKQNIKIEDISAVLYGDPSEQLYIFIHGKCGHKEEAEAFSKIACPKGYQVLSIDLPGHGQRKSELDFFVPWKIIPELRCVMEYAKGNWNKISLRANSIGAWFGMQAFHKETLVKSLFVSPVLDMEQLIKDMMQLASVTERELEEQKVISTSFGEALNWEYYKYAKLNSILDWTTPTAILYASKDNLTSRYTVDNFARRFKSKLTVMEDGEHWFHTQEQLAVLEEWERENC